MPCRFTDSDSSGSHHAACSAPSGFAMHTQHGLPCIHPKLSQTPAPFTCVGLIFCGRTLARSGRCSAKFLTQLSQTQCQGVRALPCQDFDFEALSHRKCSQSCFQALSSWRSIIWITCCAAVCHSSLGGC